MFVSEGDPLIVGIDETLERRWGKNQKDLLGKAFSYLLE
jgi:hypothetical protein